MLNDIVTFLGGPYAVAAEILVLVTLIVLVFFRSQAQAVGHFVAETWSWVWIVLMWGFPPVIMLIAWSFESLHSFSIIGGLISVGGVLVIVIGTLWIMVIQTPVANNPNTLLKTLIHDFYISTAWMIVFIAFAFYKSGVSGPELWFVMPMIIAIADVYNGTRCGFNNSYSKNPTQLERGDTAGLRAVS